MSLYTRGEAKPISKGSKFDTVITAFVNIFSTDLTPTHASTLFRIYACFNASDILTVRRTKAGVTRSETMNTGDPLVANAAYIFDVLVNSGDSINIQYGGAGTVLYLTVFEIPIAR